MFQSQDLSTGMAQKRVGSGNDSKGEIKVGKSANNLVGQGHLLLTHVPVGPLPVAHHFPHQDPEAPDITGCSIFPVCDDLWGCPAKQGT